MNKEQENTPFDHTGTPKQQGGVNFKAGDHVAMINCVEAEKYAGEVWECRSDSYIDKAGQEVVFLNGFSGCFMANCLKKTDLPVTKGVIRNIRSPDQQTENELSSNPCQLEQSEPLKELDGSCDPYAIQADHWKQQAEQSIRSKADTSSEGKETLIEAAKRLNPVPNGDILQKVAFENGFYYGADWRDSYATQHTDTAIAELEETIRKHESTIEMLMRVQDKKDERIAQLTDALKQIFDFCDTPDLSNMEIWKISNDALGEAENERLKK